MYKNNNVLFIVGPSLGHIARTITIGRQLAADGLNIQFVCDDRYDYAKKLIKPLFPLHELKVDINEDKGVLFADTVLKLVDKIKPDVVCYDLSPFPWLIQLPFLNIPEVFISNVFLTRLGKETTNQDLRFQRVKNAWNKVRKKRSLPALESYRELYERKLVLLADPQVITDLYTLPENYHCIGSCTWQPENRNNDEYTGLDNILYVSTGSTGRKKMPDLLVDSIKDILNCSKVIRTDQSHDEKTVRTFLPGNIILKHSCFAITQGGTGSSYQALENGVPVGCWPTSNNHRTLGGLLEKLNLGILFEEHNWEEKIRLLGKNFTPMLNNARAVSATLGNNRLIEKTTGLIGNL